MELSTGGSQIIIIALNQNTTLSGGVFAGWLMGVEPILRASQAPVLPLHHSHHKIYLPLEGIEPPSMP